MTTATGFTPLEYMDQTWAVRRLPGLVREILGSLGERYFIAGGYLRSTIMNEPVNDIDIFARSNESAGQLAEIIALAVWKARGKPGDHKDLIIETDNAFTIPFKPAIQIIHRWKFETVEDGLKSFDFTIAQAAIWSTDGTWRSLCSDRFYADLAAKRLCYTRPTRDEAPGGSMLRVLKFYQRGYRITLESLGDVIERIVTNLPLRGESIGRAVTRRLIEVDPSSIEASFFDVSTPGEAAEAGRHQRAPSG